MNVEQWLNLSSKSNKHTLNWGHDSARFILKVMVRCMEETHERRLVDEIYRVQPKILIAKAKVQLAFCIDVRSEPFRRHLESEGPFETIGIAGFFGLLPIQRST